MGRTADWSRRPNLIQHILQIVGERVKEYTTVKSGINKINRDGRGGSKLSVQKWRVEDSQT